MISELNSLLIHNTDGNSKTDIDCVYAYMIDISNEYDKNVYTNYLTPYCRRVFVNDSVDQIEGNVENIITFENLRSEGISSENLFEWSRSIDIIEEYEIYLITNDTKFAKQKFYNCSSIWFGSHCQYTFDLNQSIESFGDFVISSFKLRTHFSSGEKSYSCYPHLSGCYHGPEMCLDWREICDGKIDCIGDNFGLDENHCEELQMTECKENEYRCRNGAQCIPLEFFHDGYINNDCLDGTDEVPVMNLEFRYNEIDFNCLTSISFACEEKVCNAPNLFSCGDGNCIGVLKSTVHERNIACIGTNRDYVYDRIIKYISESFSLPCYTSLFYQFELNYFMNNLFSFDDWLLSNNCTVKFLPLSVQPLFAYFYLFYSTKT